MSNLRSAKRQMIRLRDTLPTPTAVLHGWRRSIRNEVLLSKRILMMMDTLRLAMLVPEWSTFEFTEYWRDVRTGLTGKEVDKVRGWWAFIWAVQRYPEDTATVRLGMLFFLREKMRRGYGKEMVIHPEKLGISDEATVANVREAVLLNFEAMAGE